MRLTSHDNEQDLTSEIDDICDSDSTSYPLKHKVRKINAGLEELVGKIVSADGRWEFDDTNYTNEPVGTGTLVEGQQRYHLTSEYLDILMIEILNKDGTQYQKIKPEFFHYLPVIIFQLFHFLLCLFLFFRNNTVSPQVMNL